MNKSKLELFIQEAAKQQQQDLTWVGNLYRQRLKELQAANNKQDQWLNSSETTSSR